MTHRTSRVPLDPSEERCVPQHECTMKTSCARYMAALPASGAKMIGAGIPLRSVLGSMCYSYLPIGKTGVADVPRPVKPAVKGIA